MRRLYVLFGAACLLLVFFFHVGPDNPNCMSRLMTVFAIVEEHSLVGDRWRDETGDHAEVGGHVYSDKAPLSSFVVAPFYWIARQVFRRPWGHAEKELGGHLGTLVASSVPFAIYATLLLWRLLREQGRPRVAVPLSMVAAFGTCVANYANVYFGHMLGAVLLLGAYVLACERERHFVVAGFLGGCSVLAEYPLVLPQCAILGYLLIGPQRWSRAIRYGTGALPTALAMFLYNKRITGSFTDFPYAHEPAQWVEMKSSFGLRWPDPSVVWELAFGQYRGIAFYASILLVLLPAIPYGFSGTRRRRVLVLVIFGTYLLFMSSYFKWNGGWCVGPRHLVPVIALVVYEGLGGLVPRGKTLLYWVLGAWGVLLSLCAVATQPNCDENIQHPAFDHYFPLARKGELTLHSLPVELGAKNGTFLIYIWLAMFLGFMVLFSWLFARAVARTSEQSSP
jgi:hypothetical protein